MPARLPYKVASALLQLDQQLNTIAPQRNERSDGFVGDPDHQSRASDHNPWWVHLGQPYVTAGDWTHDPAGGLDCARLATALREGRDRRLKYVIWADQIMAGFGGPDPWTWRAYRPHDPHRNQHRHHLHLSVVPDPRSLVWMPWLLPGLTSPAPRPTVRLGSSGPAVELLHRFLGVRRPGELGYGLFDRATDVAVRRYQAMRRLTVDGAVGPRTWAEIDQALRPPTEGTRA